MKNEKSDGAMANVVATAAARVVIIAIKLQWQ